MKVISRNPYRVLGMFANDSLRVMTANIARIRAYAKVGKTCTFESDFVELFGPIDRGVNEVEWAVSQLNDSTEAYVWRLFWIHRIDNGDSVKIETNVPTIEGYINASVISLYKKDINHFLLNVRNVFHYERTKRNLWNVEAPKFWKSGNELKELVPFYISKFNQECNEFGNSLNSYGGLEGWFWWIRSSFDADDIFRKEFERQYKELTKNKLKQIIDDGDKSIAHEYGKEYKLYWLATPCLSILKTFTNPTSNEEVQVDVQLLFDRFALCLLRFCHNTYETVKTVLLEPVLSMADFLDSKVKHYAYRQETRAQIDSLKERLIEESHHLAPKDIEGDALEIQTNIRRFCEKDDTVLAALSFVRACVRPLISIKAFLGENHPCYKYFCSRISSNALYSAEEELYSILRKSEQTESASGFTYSYIKTVIIRCLILVANINKLHLEKDFKVERLNPFAQQCENLKDKYGVSLEHIQADISLLSDAEKLAECGNDYSKLKAFVTENPDSPELKQAMAKIWEIEDNEYPSVVTAKALIAYKQKFPNSHNERKIYDALNILLLGLKNGTVFEYRMMLRLWPSHPKKAVIEGRIDLLSFKQCRCVADWQAYLYDFPNGQHRVEAMECIETFAFNECKTIENYRDFISTYANSILVETAHDKIEDLVYESCLISGDYYKYLKQYPAGRYVAFLEEKIESKVCYDAISLGNYQSYYSAYPSGKYTIKVKRAEETAFYNSCKSIADLKTYLKKYPSGIYKNDASNAINEYWYRRLVVGILVIILFSVIWLWR